jgi:hypothetical protein
MKENAHNMSLFSLSEGKAEGKSQGKTMSVRRARRIIDATQLVSTGEAAS